MISKFICTKSLINGLQDQSHYVNFIFVSVVCQQVIVLSFNKKVSKLFANRLFK